jgi:hypothetical protein
MNRVLLVCRILNSFTNSKTVHTGNMPLPPAPKLSLTDSDREQLLEISRHRSTPRGIVLRVDCSWRGPGHCQSRSGTQPVYLFAHRIACGDMTSRTRSCNGGRSEEYVIEHEMNLPIGIDRLIDPIQES